MSMSYRSLVLVSLAAALAACGKKDPSPAAAPPPIALDAAAPPVALDAAAAAPAATDDAGPAPAATDDAGPAAAGTTWDDLDDEAHTEIMRTKVMPAMKTAFRGFDSKDFAKFTCKTCHGPGAVDKTFEMPNPKLPKLDFAALKAGKDARMVKFMKETVTPEVARIIGEPVHDDAHPDGFGCLNCHVEKGK